MLAKTVFILALICLSVVGLQLGAILNALKRMWLMFNELFVEESPTSFSPVSEHYIIQSLDHFNNNDLRSFQMVMAKYS